MLKRAELPNAPHHTDRHPADFELIRRVANGDEAALTALYDRYAGVVYSVAHRVLKDEGAAEEVLQDVFYQLWCNASRYDAARGTMAGWLLVSARNRAIDLLRRRKPADTNSMEEPVPLAFNLESSVARTQLISRVKSALGILTPAQRQVLELTYFAGMTHGEIAEKTGEPLGTVKTRLRAALHTLRQVLAP